MILENLCAKSDRLLDGFAPGDWYTLIPNGTKTTVAAGNEYCYDRFQMDHTFAWHFTGKWGVFKYEEYYNIMDCEGTANNAGTVDALSDHYPVWADFTFGADPMGLLEE